MNPVARQKMNSQEIMVVRRRIYDLTQYGLNAYDIAKRFRSEGLKTKSGAYYQTAMVQVFMNQNSSNTLPYRGGKANFPLFAPITKKVSNTSENEALAELVMTSSGIPTAAKMKLVAVLAGA